MAASGMGRMVVIFFSVCSDIDALGGRTWRENSFKNMVCVFLLKYMYLCICRNFSEGTFISHECSSGCLSHFWTIPDGVLVYQSSGMVNGG